MPVVPVAPVVPEPVAASSEQRAASSEVIVVVVRFVPSRVPPGAGRTLGPLWAVAETAAGSLGAGSRS
jgi:hypothetical protein